MSSPLGLTPRVSHFYKLNAMFTVGHLDHRMHHVLVHALHSTGMGLWVRVWIWAGVRGRSRGRVMGYRNEGGS